MPSLPPDLVMLLVDTARADAFGPWGGPVATPGVDRMAAEGLTYRRAIAQAPWTLSSTSSIFSGLLPTEHGITGECFRWLDGKPSSPAEAVQAFTGPWLPEALRERGYATWGASCNAWISPWGGFDRGFDRFVHLHDRVRLADQGIPGLVRKARRAAGNLDRGGRACLEAFHGLLKDAGSRPQFAFVNLMEVHSPYDPPRPFYPFPFWRRPGTRALTVGTTRFLRYNAGVASPPEGYVPAIRKLYYAGARYADRLVAGFADAVRRRGRPTVVILVSDHGENLGEHGMFHHNSSLHHSLLHAPLLMWASGVDFPSGVVEDPVSLGGLLSWSLNASDGEPGPLEPGGPIVAEYESAVRHNGIPEEVREALGSVDPSSLPPLLYRPGLAVYEETLKYLAAEDGPRAVFDLADDPGEQHDLIPTRPDLADRFAPQVEAWAERRRRRPTYEAGEVAEGEIAEHLSMLGYIE
jgi:arylsulfatase A-like enzyme